MSYFNKNKAFTGLTKTQKAALLSYLKLFAKKNINLSANDILEEFIEEERYYKNVGNIHFEWIFSIIDDVNFLDEIKNYISFLLYEFEQKEKQKPYIEAQKVKMKEFRQLAHEFKMSKQQPTKKQLYYYEKLCKEYNLPKMDIENMSRLDMRNIIDKILADKAQL